MNQRDHEPPPCPDCKTPMRLVFAEHKDAGWVCPIALRGSNEGKLPGKFHRACNVYTIKERKAA